MILAWLDLETPGFLSSPRNDFPLEMAIALTGPDLVPIPGASLSLVIKPPFNTGWREAMDPVVLKMHTKNGLLRDLPSAISLQEAEWSFVDLINKHMGHADRVRVAGVGVVNFDLPRLKVHMPTVFRRFDDKPLDLLHVRRFVRDICGHSSPFEGRGKHRAMPDVEDALDEARHLRSLLQEGHS